MHAFAKSSAEVIPGAQAEASASDLASLLSAAADGDEQAFGSFYDRTSHRVYGMVLRVLRDAAQAAEVTQDAYLQVWQRAGQFDPAQGEVLPWLLMIAHRRAVDRVRAAQAAAVRDDRYAALHAQRPYDSVAEDVLAALEAEGVRTAIAELSEPQRRALTLAYFGGHTHAEIATLLNIPLGTAKTRIRDGLSRLRGLVPAHA